MSTDAKALHDFLIASGKASVSTRLGDFACSYLSLEKGQFGEALLAIQGLAFRINKSINTMDMPETERNEVFKYFSPFQPLLDYTSYRQNMSWARSNFIKDAYVGKLVILDAIIAGKVGHVPELSNISSLRDSIDDVIQEFKDSDLPSNLREAILKRLLQIQSALKNYEVFGAQSVIDETAKIIGVISMYNDVNSQTSVNKSDAVSKFRKYSTILVKGISKSRDLVEDLQFLGDAGAEAAGGLLEDMSDKA